MQKPLFYEPKVLFADLTYMPRIQNVSQFCTTTKCVYEPVLFVSTSGSILRQKREKPKLMNKSGNSTIVKPHTPHHIFLLICVRQDVLLSYPVYIGHYTDSLTMTPTTLLYETCVHSLNQKTR